MNMFTKKTLYLLLCTMLGYASGHAQTSVIFSFNNGLPNKSYLISDLQKFTFPNDATIRIEKKVGGSEDIDLNTVLNYRYSNPSTPTSVTELQNVSAPEVLIYPNPFRGAVRIKYSLPAADQIAIEVFDMTGRSVKQWPAEKKTAGTYEVIWQTGDVNSKALPSGTYICRIQTSKGTISKMMVME
jgi:hypothetical protein